MQSQKIKTIKSKDGNLSWFNIAKANKKEIEYLRRKFKFNALDLEDSYAKAYAQRPKFHVRNNYAFLILQFPIFDKKTGSIVAEEIDFFIDKNNLIILHKNNLPPVVEFFKACSEDKFYRNQYMNEGPGQLLYEIITQLQDYCYPILDHISVDMKTTEEKIFNGHEREMISKIAYIKRNISDVRKILEAHKNALQKITKEKIPFLPMNKLKIYYSDLIEGTKNIWDILESQKALLESLENTNNTLVSAKLNDIMKTLTIFSVIVFPLTLLAAIFGMNTVNGMPLMDSPYGFWIIIGIMLIGVLFMFIFFKSRKWL